MLIGIDGNEANVKNRAGVGQYAFELIRHLEKLDSENFYSTYLKNEPLPDLPPKRDKWTYQIFGPKKLWTQLAAPLHLRLFSPKPDVFFTPSHYAPRFCPIPSVISIMDIAFVHFPQMFKKKDLAQLESWTAYSVKQAKKVLTISDFSKKDILEHYKIPEDKVVVTHPGLDRGRFNENVKHETEKIEEIKKKYKIPENYLIFIGTLQPRKNIVRLVEALKPVLANYPDTNLVVTGMINVGRGGWMYKEIFEKVNDLGLIDKVIFTNYVPDEDVPYLLAGAKAYILPSLYEGFGIPVVEAMAIGLPVVVSNASSLPEITEDAGIYVEPYNVQSITDGIKKVLSLTEGQRKTLIEKGFAQAKKFDWIECAKKTLEVLKEVVEKTSS